MKTVFALLGALGLLAAVPALSADENAGPGGRPPQKTCLQNNRIYTWRVVNEREMIVGDIQGNQFTVHLTSGCVGLTDAILALRFDTVTNLGCLQHGDRISFREPTLGGMTCVVTDVKPGLPPKNAKGHEE